VVEALLLIEDEHERVKARTEHEERAVLRSALASLTKRG